MEYPKVSTSVNSNHSGNNSIQYNSDSIQSNDSGSINQQKMYDEKQNFQYCQTNTSSLNQLLQNSPYSNSGGTPSMPNYPTYKNIDGWNPEANNTESVSKSESNAVQTTVNVSSAAPTTIEKSENNGNCYGIAPQYKTSNPYENPNYGASMMLANNYYSQMRYSNPQNYLNSPVANRAPLNYPGYMQTSSPGPGGYVYHPGPPPPQIRSFNIHNPYLARNSQSPYPPEPFINGNTNVPSKESSEKPDATNNANQDNCSVPTVSSNKTSNRSNNTKSKANSKNESHPATPASNNVASPSQTSMSSMENEDSVSSLGPGDQQQQLGVVPSSQAPTPTMSTQAPQHMMMAQYPPPAMYHQQYPGMPSYMTRAPPPQFAPGHRAPPPYPHQPAPTPHTSVYHKLLELGNEPDRPSWLDRYLRFMHDNGSPLTAVPSVVKQPLDLYRLYHAVRERGGLLNVVKTKRWKEICLIVNVNASASGAYTLRRNYIKCLLDFECKFDRNGVDPGPILQEIQSLSDKKKKTSRNSQSSPSTLSSGQCSNSEYPGSGPSTPRPTPSHEFGPSTPAPPTSGSYPSGGSGGGPGPNAGPYNGVAGPSMMHHHRSPMHYGPGGPPTRVPTPQSTPVQMQYHHHHHRMTPPPQQPMYSSPPTLYKQSTPQQWPPVNNTPNPPQSIPSSVPNNTPSGSPSTAISNSNHTMGPYGIDSNRRVDWKSNYGGMPPPPAPPPNSQSTRPPNMVPPNMTAGPTSSSSMPGTMIPNQYPTPIPPHMAHIAHHHQSQSSTQVSHHSHNSSTSSLQHGSIIGPFSINQTRTTNCHQALQYNKQASNTTSLPPISRNQLDSNSNRINQSYHQMPFSKSGCGYVKRYENLFPPDSVEAIQPDLNRKRKYSSKDIKAFNASSVTMALKSGLVCETNWYLNFLTIWSRDEQFVEKMSLKNMMPLYQSLLDVWRNILASVFGSDFIADLELPVELDKKSEDIRKAKEALKQMDKLLKAHQKLGSNEVECESHQKNGTIKAIKKEKDSKDQLLNLLSGDKYGYDRRGYQIKLESEGRLERAVLDNEELCKLVMESLLDGCDGGERGEEKLKKLKEIWKLGGADTTMHILPATLTENRCDEINWNIEERVDTKKTKMADDFVRSSEILPDGENLFVNCEEWQEEQIGRLISVSTIIRNLSFNPGNDRIMASSRGLLSILGRLLLLGHDHDYQNKARPWWLRFMDDIREHVLVTIVHVSSYIQLDQHDDAIVCPLVTGLVHWLTCHSTAAAEDPLPSHRVLGCRRLALEALMRLCVHEPNRDFILAAPCPPNTLSSLFDYLALCFSHPDSQVVREMSLALLNYLSQAGNDGLGCLFVARARPSVIGGLISFIELTESQIRHIVDNMGMEALQARPELMGTSLEFLRHSGALLNRLAGFETNHSQFSRDHEQRMLNLVISTVLDQTVAQSISSVLFQLTRSNSAGSSQHCTTTLADLLHNTNSSNTNPTASTQHSAAFLTFNDLSFCDDAAPSQASPSSQVLSASAS